MPILAELRKNKENSLVNPIQLPGLVLFSIWVGILSLESMNLNEKYHMFYNNNSWILERIEEEEEENQNEAKSVQGETKDIRKGLFIETK